MSAQTEHSTLERLAVGSRLIVRSRTDWRFAAVSRISENRVVLTVCSPSGRTYRLYRDKALEIQFFGTVPVLPHESFSDTWTDNFCCYDTRW